MKTTNN